MFKYKYKYLHLKYKYEYKYFKTNGVARLWGALVQ